MTTRQKQFELDRQKMLASIGQEPDEPKIEVEEEEPEVKEQDMIDYEEKLDALKTDKPSLEEYKNRIYEAFDEKCEFDSSLSDMTDEERKNAKTLRHNNHVRTKERSNHRGEADGFGIIICLLDDFQATFGGGIIYYLYLMFITAPVTLHWYIKANWLCAIIALVAFSFVGRLMGCWLSYLARGAMEIAIRIGPQFVCDVREGTPALKLIVSLLNKALWIGKNSPTFAFIGLFCLCAFSSNWTRQNWIDQYIFFFGLSFVFSFGMWVWYSLMGYAIYAAIISGLMSGTHPTKYRLRYLNDNGRIMIPTRKVNGKFISKEKRLKAFKKAYTGIA